MNKKKQQYQLVKQVHPYNKKQRRHQRRQCGSCLFRKVTTAFEKKYPEAKITSLQLDTDFGRYFYEIEGVDQQKNIKLK